MRFCAERALTVDQFFAMTKGLPRAIDEARDDLEADIRADPSQRPKTAKQFWSSRRPAAAHQEARPGSAASAS